VLALHWFQLLIRSPVDCKISPDVYVGVAGVVRRLWPGAKTKLNLSEIPVKGLDEALPGEVIARNYWDFTENVRMSLGAQQKTSQQCSQTLA
jgi:hypothetical protein